MTFCRRVNEEVFAWRARIRVIAREECEFKGNILPGTPAEFGPQGLRCAAATPASHAGPMTDSCIGTRW